MSDTLRFSFVIALFSIGVAISPAALQNKGDAAKSDEEMLQGTWNYSVAEIDGRPPIRKKLVVKAKDGAKPPAKKKGFPGHSIAFQGNRFEIKFGDALTQAGTYKLDSSKKPRTIDLAVTDGEDKGAVQRGIYELKGHVFTVCFDPKGNKRPTELKAPMASGNVLTIMQRAIEPGVDPLDASVVYDNVKRMGTGFMLHNGKTYDKAAVFLEPKAKLVLPDKATVVGRHDQGDVVLLYMAKRIQMGFHVSHPVSVLDYREKMGCAVKREKDALLIGTYGEFGFLEGNVSMALLVLVPPNFEVERRAGLIATYGKQSGAPRSKDAINPARDDPKPALTKTKEGSPGVWLTPVVEDGWHAIPAVPDVERRVSKGM
jgi:uncharacterized protein (TIGR03067 family)